MSGSKKNSMRTDEEPIYKYKKSTQSFNIKEEKDTKKILNECSKKGRSKLVQ